MVDFAPRTRECLTFVVQHAAGHYQPTESLQWMGAPIDAAAPTPESIKQLATYSYLGDMAVRFVFRAPDCTDLPVRHQDLAHLDLAAERAFVTAIVNFKRANGMALTGEFTRGVHMLRGVNADTYANYFFDRTLWRSQLRRFPAGILVALPKQGSLFFVDAGDPVATAELAQVAVRFFTPGDKAAISGFLYRFSEAGWQIHGPLAAADGTASKPAVQPGARLLAPRPLGSPATVTPRVTQNPTRNQEDGEDNEAQLALAAQGQKMVIQSLVANFVLGGVERSQVLPGLVLWCLAACIAVYSLVGIVRICSGLNKVQGEKIVFMVLSCIPLANLVVLVYLSMKTSRVLRQAGWTVGFLGAKP